MGGCTYRHDDLLPRGRLRCWGSEPETADHPEGQRLECSGKGKQKEKEAERGGGEHGSAGRAAVWNKRWIASRVRTSLMEDAGTNSSASGLS